ncbi:MAG: hypothetical protein HY300_07935 [Verrucomicrobia bacterium]|nr:hypothetical protein [Verrucomicrobiota bacterium]
MKTKPTTTTPKVPRSFLFLLSVIAFALSASAQALYFQPVSAVGTEVKVINNSSYNVSWGITNGEDPSDPSGGTLYETWARIPDVANWWADVAETPGSEFVTASGVTDSMIPEFLYMMESMSDPDPNPAQIRLVDFLGSGADQLWWSVHYYYDTSYVGFNDLSYTDSNGALHIVYEFYDLP